MDKLYLLIIAILPGFLITAYIYWRDRHEPEPLWLLAICFLFGVASTYPAIKMEEFGMYDIFIVHSSDVWMTFTFAFLTVAFSEELVKYIFLRYYIYPKDEFCEPMDGIVYSVTISMGFATLENILYIVVRSNPDDFQHALEIGYARMFTAVPAHAAFAMVMGYFVGLAKFRPDKEAFYQFCGLSLAVVLHGLYDFFIFQEMSHYLTIFTFVTLIGAIVIGKFMVHWHVNDSPYKNQKRAHEEQLPNNNLPPPTEL